MTAPLPTISSFVWAATEDAARDLQSHGWKPCPKSMEMHHGEYGLLLRFDGPVVEAVSSVLRGGE